MVDKIKNCSKGVVIFILDFLILLESTVEFSNIKKIYPISYFIGKLLKNSTDNIMFH
jgi:hypothetical protein